MYLVQCVIILCSLLLLPFRIVKRDEKFLLLLLGAGFILVCTYAFYTDDYASYVDIVRELAITSAVYPNIEPFWRWFIHIFGGNVHWFRFAVFFIINLGLIVIAMVSKLPKLHFLCYILILSFSSYATWVRMPFASVFFMLGIIMIAKKNVIFGSLLCLCSLFLHKGSIILLMVLPFLLVKYRRRNILIAAVMAMSFSFLIELLSSVNLGFDYMMYLNHGSLFENRHWIYSWLSTIRTGTLLMLVYRTIVLVEETALCQFNIILQRFLSGVLIMSVFFIISPLSTETLYQRLLMYAYIPMAVIWSMCIRNRILLKRVSWLPILLVFYIMIDTMTVIVSNNTVLYELIQMPF